MFPFDDVIMKLWQQKKPQNNQKVSILWRESNQMTKQINLQLDITVTSHELHEVSNH